MSAATQGGKERSVEEDARNGSDSPKIKIEDNSEKYVVSHPRSTSSRTEDNLLIDSKDDSSSSMHTVVMDTHSDDELALIQNYQLDTERQNKPLL